MTPVDTLLPNRRAWLASAQALIIGHVAVVLGNLLALASRGHLSPAGKLHAEQGPWTWDAGWYVQLGKVGYQGVNVEGYRFFPLFPMIGRMGRAVSVEWTLLIVNNIAALVGVYLLCRWVHEVLPEPKSPEMALRAGWATALFPAAFAFTWAYSEGLMLCLVGGYLLTVSRKNWLGAATLGFLAALARPTGVLLVTIPMVELTLPLLRRWLDSRADNGSQAVSKQPDGRARPNFGAVAAIIGPLLGLASVFWWVGRATGDPWLPMTIQRQLRAGFHEPFTKALTMVASVARGDGSDLWNLAFLALAAGSLWFSRARLPVSALAYGALTLVVTMSANNVNSLGRYALTTPPLVIGWAWAARGHRTRMLLAASGIVGIVGFTWLAATGTVVP